MSEWKVTGAPRFVEGVGMVYPVTKGGSRFDVREQEELEALLAEWQPIDTAPKDGSRIMLRSPGGKVADGFFGVKYKVWSWPYVVVEPTHWRPMIPGPTN